MPCTQTLRRQYAEGRIIGVLFFAAFFCLSTEQSFAANPLPWENQTGYRAAKLDVSNNGQPGFTELSNAQTGIQWTNTLSVKNYAGRQNLMNGAGVALGDFDGDGWCDIYLCNKEGANALYRNLGDWKFEDVAARSNVTCTHQSSTGATFADINGDGRLDLLVTSFRGPNACFINLGNGTFKDVTKTAGLVSKTGGTSQALGDIDGDGDLDLYVNSFGIEALLRDGASFSTRMVRGKPVVMGRYAKRLAIEGNRLVEFGEPDTLFLNDGKGNFTPVEWKDRFRNEEGRAIGAPRDFGLAVQIRDINADGFPDIYVCNDFQTPDRLWLNDGRGYFQAIEKLALRNMSYASMGADFGDLDRDGFLDFFAVEMLSGNHARHLDQSSPITPLPRTVGSIGDREEFARNTLCWNRGDNTFEETAFFSGVAASDWSWTPIFLDVDLDGYEDILISNGHMHDVNDRDVSAARRAETSTSSRRRNQTVLLYPPLLTPNRAFKNHGDRTFSDNADGWGFNSLKITHGLAMADLDNDGDLDLVGNCINAPPLVYQNNSSAPRIAVRLKGPPHNRQGIGAKITVSGGSVTQSQEIICGGRYLSGDDAIRTFAAGNEAKPLHIEVFWPSGARSTVNDAQANHLYEVDAAGAKEISNPKSKIQNPKSIDPFFEDVSHLIAHTHREPSFDDFAFQPLLPKKLSQLGPGIAWFDLDGDGDDELIVGTGKGGTVAVFRNDGSGKFNRWKSPTLDQPLPDDSTAILGWASGNGKRSILLGLSKYETTAAVPPSVLRFDFADNIYSRGVAVGEMKSSVGPMALADLDGDGDLDLFAGGRVNPRRYPESASSRIYRSTENGLELDIENSRLLENVGLVSAAVFSDFNGDDQPDLALACEWGSIRVFQNTQGVLHEVTADLGFASQTGLWSSIAAGDFDNDGRMDLVAGNWGVNSFYNLASDGPWHLYFGDLNGDGQVQMLETYTNRKMNKVVPWRDMQLHETVFPWLREQFTTHKSFARSGVSEILGNRASNAKTLAVSTLRSTVFLNRGKKFEAVALPSEAQFAPVFGLSVGDLDGDGYEDLFLSQNCFALRTEDNRLDAGRGLWLKGDGTGRFKAVKGQESGIKIYGEQRGCALADYDQDGRLDLAVTQNGAATKLYRNVGAKPGLRVRLIGSNHNPDGIGARIRLLFGERKGPTREIHTGAGYWSQDSSTIVIGTSEVPTAIQVRWPWENVTTSPIPEGAKEITIDRTGTVKIVM